MANIDEALVTYLKAHAGLSALIGARLYPDELPQNCTLPAVMYFKVSDVKEHCLANQLNLERPTYQFSVMAATKAAAKTTAVQLKAALSDYSGTLSGIAVQRIMLINELSSLEKTPDGTMKIYYEDLEYEVIYST